MKRNKVKFFVFISIAFILLCASLMFLSGPTTVFNLFCEDTRINLSITELEKVYLDDSTSVFPVHQTFDVSIAKDSTEYKQFESALKCSTFSRCLHSFFNLVPEQSKNLTIIISGAKNEIVILKDASHLLVNGTAYEVSVSLEFYAFLDEMIEANKTTE